MTESEVRDFSEFAQRKLKNGGACSLEACLQEWREEQMRLRDVASIRRGLAEADAGLLCDFDEVDAELRQKYALSQRS